MRNRLRDRLLHGFNRLLRHPAFQTNGASLMREARTGLEDKEHELWTGRIAVLRL